MEIAKTEVEMSDREPGAVRAHGRAVAAVAVLLVCAGSAQAAEGEYRADVTVRMGVPAGTIVLKAEVRSQGQADNVGYGLVSAGLTGAVGQHLKVGAQYANVQQRRSDSWGTEHRPCVDAEVRWAAMGLKVGDRNRFEMRVRDGDESFRYRNRVRVSRRLGTDGPVLSVDDEWFVDLDEREFNKNRVTAGFSARVGERASVGVFYVHEDSRTAGGWATVHAVRLSVGCDL